MVRVVYIINNPSKICDAVWIVKKKNQKKITENVTMPIKVQDCKEKKENEFDKIFEENIHCRPKDS